MERKLGWSVNIEIESDVYDGAFISISVLLSENHYRRRIEGYFHQLRQNEHSKIEANFGRYHIWVTQCETAGLTAGACISIKGSGARRCELISKRLGPFLSALA